jgi:hypothetical protein
MIQGAYLFDASANSFITHSFFSANGPMAVIKTHEASVDVFWPFISKLKGSGTLIQQIFIGLTWDVGISNVIGVWSLIHMKDHIVVKGRSKSKSRVGEITLFGPLR